MKKVKPSIQKKGVSVSSPALDIATVFNEALKLHEARRFSEAEKLYRRVLEAQPNAEIFNNRAAALQELKRPEEALESYDRAIALKPDYADAFNNRGTVLKDLGRLDEALASYERAIALNPRHAEAFYNKGKVLQELRRLDEALASYDRAIALKPGYAKAFNNRGTALQDMNRLEEALASCDKAIALNSGYAEAFNNRGTVLEGMNRLNEALASYDRAILLHSLYPEAFHNRGNTLKALKRLDDALTSYDQALALKSDFADAYYGRGLAGLVIGRYREAWPDHEWRWKTRGFPSRPPKFNAPVWQGENLTGRRIVVFAEQGMGDVIQFARYLPLLVRRGAAVTFFSPAGLVRLLRPLDAEIEIISAMDGNEAFDFQCALMSLPHRFGTELSSIPDRIPYLLAEDDLIAKWKDRIGEHGFKIGIAWQGNPKGKIDQGRSIPLSEYVPLSGVPGVRLISLQKTHGLDQLSALPDGTVETLGEDFDTGPDAFVDTASVMSHLDLIITSDTSIAHLAGALGRPTWVALKHIPDWRWLLDREDSPWYPTMRLFRQQTDGDWKPVFAKIEQELDALRSDRRTLPDRRVSETVISPSERKSAEPEASASAARRPLLENANLRLKRCKHGTMMFYANDTYIGRSLDLYGEFSEGEMALFERFLQPGMTVVDAGANIGVHTLYFAQKVGPSGRVVAFEPQRVLHQILCGNVALNLHANVLAVNAGLGAEPGSIALPPIDYARGGNFGGIDLGRHETGEQVPVRTLDSCGFAACHLIKIDVEGMEQWVLEGAKTLLKEHQPLLYVENDRPEKSRDLIQWLLSNGYRLYWHLPRL
ncbi:MAG TPA: FkbM family methyltransferase, partial [Micropepsaceae bacterium]|nr:FkbM family methyltransferase [Micropepsaceae bacterium]